jgi:hypothetical protein
MTMHETGTDLREALKKIAKVASAAIGGSEYEGNGHNDDEAQEGSLQQYMVGCTLKSLPKRLLVKAADTAVKINPVNAPALAPMAGVAADVPLEPMRIAVLTSKYWGPAPRRLTVSFMEITPRRPPGTHPQPHERVGLNGGHLIRRNAGDWRSPDLSGPGGVLVVSRN